MPVKIDQNAIRRNERLASLAGNIWAMLPQAWDGLLATAGLDDREPVSATDDEPQSRLPKMPAIKGSIAVLPVHGIIGQRMDWWTDVSTDWLGQKLDELMANNSIGAVVMDFDTPGGSVYGTPELAEKIRSYRDGPKPIYAVANSTAFSAGYWLAAQASKLFVVPSGKVGSIGVWKAHVDISKYEDDIGIKTTLVSAGKYKVEGHCFAPLDDEAREEMQRSVDYYHDKFLAAVAAGRGVKAADVRKNYGEGRLIEAPRAVQLGMADGVATLEEVLGKMMKNQRDTRERAGELELIDAELAIKERE